MVEKLQAAHADFAAEVRSRFGVLPNFFCTASSAPGLIQQLWGFAKAGYLDNPLPSLFKERLFVHLSRFCEIRYCIVRHVGFLVGEGRPAGDAEVRPHSIEQAITLLSRPVPNAQRLDQSLSLLQGLKTPIAIPEPEDRFEGALFDVLTILFISPQGAERARSALAHALGEATFEILIAFLAFVRTAHYWTQTHPTLGYEPDMLALMEAQPDLARLMLDTSDSEWARSSEALRRALAELRNTSGALRSSEERYRALATATSDVLFRVSPDWTEMRAMDGKDLLADADSPDADWMTHYIPESERGRVNVAIEQAKASKRLFELEHRVFRRDGSEGWILSRAVPLLDEQGAIVEWFGTAMDLTSRKDAEEALRQADRKKDEFLATLAHELRNPLAPLRNGLLIARGSGPSDATLLRAIQMMERQVNLLVHLVDDLLDVSRITSGKFELRRNKIKVRDVLAASVEASRAIFEAHKHSLIVGPCDEKLAVNGDFDRLTQVFFNLLSNAAKYTKEPGTVELNVRREGRDVAISISDTGIGIPATALSSIFEMFSQIHEHRGQSEGGLGIGLSLVRQLTEMHGGSAIAASLGAGKGSTFTVRLPLLEESDSMMEEEAHAGAPTEIPVPSRRILVVDDNEDAAATLAQLLSQSGHEVITAADGLEGIDKAKTFRPQIVFLDLGMPKMDGLEAARRLRALPGGHETTLVALTGWGQEQDLKRTRDVGFDYHLLKPVDPDALIHCLASSHPRSPP